MIPTPHISAESKSQIAKTVLMPGDPLRAKFIVETFLENPVEFNAVRGMLGYTGSYQGKTISVMGSGMGMPSIGIYSYELFSFYGVENIVRIGSAGAYTEDHKIYDVVLVEDAWSESSYARTQNTLGADPGPVIPSDPQLNMLLENSAKREGIPMKRCRAHSSDVFYHEDHEYFKKVAAETGCQAVEMESFALFHNARITGKKAACILTISDSLITHQATTSEERQNAFTNMMKIALGAEY